MENLMLRRYAQVVDETSFAVPTPTDDAGVSSVVESVPTSTTTAPEIPFSSREASLTITSSSLSSDMSTATSTTASSSSSVTPSSTTSSAPTSTQTSSGSSGGLSTGELVAAIVVPVVVFLILIGLAGFCLHRRRRGSKATAVAISMEHGERGPPDASSRRLSLTGMTQRSNGSTFLSSVPRSFSTSNAGMAPDYATQIPSSGSSRPPSLRTNANATATANTTIQWAAQMPRSNEQHPIDSAEVSPTAPISRRIQSPPPPMPSNQGESAQDSPVSPITPRTFGRRPVSFGSSVGDGPLSTPSSLIFPGFHEYGREVGPHSVIQAQARGRSITERPANHISSPLTGTVESYTTTNPHHSRPFSVVPGPAQQQQENAPRVCFGATPKPPQRVSALQDIQRTPGVSPAVTPMSEDFDDRTSMFSAAEVLEVQMADVGRAQRPGLPHVVEMGGSHSPSNHERTNHE